jgi:hypothetical protein
VSEREYEPGTRFVVIEIPPAVDDEIADEITEKLFDAAGAIDQQYDGPWDLFIYRQHNAPPVDVPAVRPQPTREQIREALNKAYAAGMNRYNSGKINPPSEVEKLDQIEAALFNEESAVEMCYQDAEDEWYV